MLLLSLFIFAKWNMIITAKSIRFIIAAIYIDLLIIIIIVIKNFIKINNFEYYFMFYSTFTL